MANRFLIWYERDWTAQRAQTRIAAMETAGLALAHPTTGRITMISNDLDTIGEQVTTDRATLIRSAALDCTDEVTFQYWLDQDDDVSCSISRLDTGDVSQVFYLDGLTLEQMTTVIHAVVAQIHADPSTTIGLVLDRWGGSDGEDWDAVITGAPTRVTIAPEAIGVLSTVAARHPELRNSTPAILGGITIYDPGRALNRLPRT